ncbi:TetR/AcrR family transcriptional regulator [Microvirga lotononidis]|uniref:Transcriptional regulator n=1 Tax=Microvirga lotononidis TaxID=864069 RepID=I4YSY1_9HYPH|nr:TetR/AcrR family transcriptional regulator [Microvirga lotononidis]EIM27073.1 transcriptional regulator [Microvirga lotononidis]WQO28738.1 TetR/AcrR family transcriptional regulator [Microvirga lotononidis]
MNAKQQNRTYESAVRKEQVDATRQRILAAVGALFDQNPEHAFSLDEVAREAGISRRTIFRYFATKEELIDAFWLHINASSGAGFPRSEEDLVRRPVELFESLESVAGVVRASHLSAAGHAMRLRASEERRAAFRVCLADVTAGMAPEEAVKLEAVVQLLYSATAWLTIKDYWGLSGREGGEAVSWAIETLINEAKRKKHAMEAAEGTGSS